MFEQFKIINEKTTELSRQAKATDRDFILQAIARGYLWGKDDHDRLRITGRLIMKANAPVQRPRDVEQQCNGDPYHFLRLRLNKTVLTLRAFEHLGYEKPSYSSISRCYLWNADQAVYDWIETAVKDVLQHIDTRYLYIFVRQDICPEQQAVQAAHAVYVSGANGTCGVDPNYVHFVLIGVPGLEELTEAWRKFYNFHGQPFFEGDMNDEMTAFACGPVRQADRHNFRDYKILKFGS